MIHVWDLGSGGVLRECNSTPAPSTNSSQPITSLAFSPDGGLLASSGSADQIKLWNVRTLSTPLQTQNSTSRYICCFLFLLLYTSFLKH